MANKKLESMVYWYLSTPFHLGNNIYSYYTITHELTKTHIDSIFYRLVPSPTKIGNIDVHFLLTYFCFISSPTMIPTSLNFDDDLPAP